MQMNWRGEYLMQSCRRCASEKLADLNIVLTEMTAIKTIVRVYHQGICQFATLSGEVTDSGQVNVTWEFEDITSRDLEYARHRGNLREKALNESSTEWAFGISWNTC
ncbi:hypothetical protein BC936DRAFT_143809 [Jimgerdemannia flammicorona]|uniref:Uncharacterized protein n=1 Tax=Jimgerdemannia flammicorona TaxID=994334 RepID=A0A432ZYG3_9FUNG|nr:hypothetical protein BC936DRAFT_143809 [Jimgerdemannia flammicorona]